MKEDYLWDKTGEPDPDIQELEQVLGTLRYQPRPLDIPAGVAPYRNHAVSPRLLAIAATIAVMLLGIGLWFGLQRTQTGQVSTVEKKPVTTSGGDQAAVTQPNEGDGPVTPLPEPRLGEKQIPHRVNGKSLSHELVVSRRPKVNTPELTAAERREAEIAKEQLMIALRVASSKLSFAQKKAQEINSENQTHNQHKIG